MSETTASTSAGMPDRKKISAPCRSARGPIVSLPEVRTMKYMLLTYLDEKAWLALSPEEQKAQMDSCAPHIQKLMEKKRIIAGAPLHSTSTATTVKYRDGKQLLIDGPFAETREQLGGYTIIEADNLDE